MCAHLNSIERDTKKAPESEDWSLHDGLAITRCSPSSTENTSTSLPLLKRIGHYEIIGELGAGGYGTVYRARHMWAEGFESAIKILHANRQDSVREERFLSEIRLAGALDHTNILRVRDCGYTEDRRLYVIMPLIRGETFRDFFEREWKHRDHGKIEWASQGTVQFFSSFDRICDAIEYMHDRGVVHRDLKPENIALDFEKSEYVPPTSTHPKHLLGKHRTYLIDLGIAHSFGEITYSSTDEPAALCARNLTPSGSFIGTPSYVTPEHAKLKGSPLAEPASDTWALAVMLYEFLTSRVPFGHSGTSWYGILAHVENPNTAPAQLTLFDPSINPLFQRIIDRALEKRPEHRITAVSELRKLVTEAYWEQLALETDTKKDIPS